MSFIKEFVEMRKSGKFYNTFGDDAIILHYLLGYKIVSSKGGVGFPESAFNKVINVLEEHNISYQVSVSDKIIAEHTFNNNSYRKILRKGQNDFNVEQRFKVIEEKIRKMKQKELDAFIELIEDAIS